MSKEEKRPRWVGPATAALAGLAGYAALRRFRPSTVRELRELQEAAKAKKGFGIVMEGNQGKAVEGLLGSKVYEPHNAPTDRVLLHHGVDDLARKATKTDINAGDVPYELGDKKTFPEMLERAGAGSSTPRTKSVGALSDRSHKGIQDAVGSPNFVVKERMGSMTKADDLITEKTPHTDPKWRDVHERPDQYIAQERVPIKREYRVHTLNNVPFSATHRRLPHEGARRVWNKVVEKIQGDPGGGGSFLPVVGKKRRQLHEFVRESTKNLPTGTHQAFDVAEDHAGNFKLIESNPFPGSIANPVIARRLQREATGRWGHDVAVGGGLAVAGATEMALHHKREKRASAPSPLLTGFAEEMFKLADMGAAIPMAAPAPAPAPAPMPTPPSTGEPLKYYQQRVVNRITQPDQPGLVVAHGLGTGKTRTSIEAQKALGMDAAVVVPASLKGNYEKEVHRWNPNSRNKTEIGSLQGAAASGKMPNEPLLIVDEAHRMRDPGSKTYQAIRTSPAKKRILLTASPFYNHPSDIAPLIDAAAGQEVLPKDREGFNKRYVSTEKIKPGFFDRIRGVHPGEREVVNPKSKPELTKVFKKWVDYHQGTQDDFPTVARQDIKVPMSKDQLHMYDAMLGRAPAWVSRKIKAGLPPDKAEAKQLNAFLGAVRQISNTTRPFQTKGTPSEPKIDAAFGEAKKTLASNPRAKVVVYSNYIGAGIDPYKERLKAEGIPYGEFVGGMKKADRDELVRKYNAGEIKVLLLSSAGGEGLDLKGTRSIQVLDPHWNWEKIKQVEGRGIRYKSHAGLPPEEQNVVVQRFISTRPRSGILEGLHLKKPGHAVDEYLQQMSYDKERLIDQFKALLPKEEAQTKTAGARPRPFLTPRMHLGFAVEVLEKKAAGVGRRAMDVVRNAAKNIHADDVIATAAIGLPVAALAKRVIMGKQQEKVAVSDRWLRDKIMGSDATIPRLDRFTANMQRGIDESNSRYHEKRKTLARENGGVAPDLPDTAGDIFDSKIRRQRHKAMDAAEDAMIHAPREARVKSIARNVAQPAEMETNLARFSERARAASGGAKAGLGGGTKGLLLGGALALPAIATALMARHMMKNKGHEKQAVSKEWIKARTRAGAEKAKMPRLAQFNAKMQAGGNRAQRASDVAEDLAHQVGDDPDKLSKMHSLFDEAEQAQGAANKYRHAAASSADIGLERLERVRRLGGKAALLGGVGLLGITGAILANRHGKEAPRKWTVKHAAPASGKLVSELEEFANVLKKPKKVPRGTPPHGTPHLPHGAEGAMPHKPVVYDASGRTYRDTVGARMRKETEDALAEGLKEAAVKLLRFTRARQAA